MGEELPDEEKIRAYSPFSVYGGSIWERDTKTKNSPPPKSEALLVVFLSVISIGIVGLVCSVIVFIKLRR